MKILIEDIEINDDWDYQRAYLMLKLQDLSGKVLTTEQRDTLNKEVTLFMWDEIKKQFPDIEMFCTGKTGGFNKIDTRHHKTPIISVHGSFYLQLITKNNRDESSVDYCPCCKKAGRTKIHIGTPKHCEKCPITGDGGWCDEYIETYEWETEDERIAYLDNMEKAVNRRKVIE